MSSNQYTSVHVGTGITKIHSHKVSYTWIIEDFNFHETKGDELNSSFFSAKTNDEYKWCLTLNPHVESKIKDDTNDQLEELFCSPVHDTEQVCKVNPEYHSWGWDDFLRKDEKFRSEYLRNNRLTIRVDLTFSDMRKNDVCGFEVPICDITESIAKLYEDHKFADAIISVNGKDYPVHKSILCARSRVFAAMFGQQMKDDERNRNNFEDFKGKIADEIITYIFTGKCNSLDDLAQGLITVADKYDLDGLKIQNTKENQRNRVEICDIKEEVVGEMLRYIYTGECENLESFAEDLLAAADKYGLDRLKMMCAEVLFRNLSSENVAHILILAEIHGVNEVKSEAIKFIASRFDEVMNTEGWKKVLAKPELMNDVCLALYHR